MTGTTIVTAAAAFAAVGFPDVPARLVVMALAVAGYVAMVADTRANAAVTTVAYLLFDGFLVNKHGELSWDGTTSMSHLAVFVVAVGLGLARRSIHYARHRGAPAAELDYITNILSSNDKESHGA